MAGCFDFRMRTSSFDLHQLAQRHKLTKISKLFRSKSDENVKDKSESPKGSPSGGSPSNVQRRRFVRVVRNEEATAEEWDNPHVIRRYTQEYLQKQWQTLAEVSVDEPPNVPYEVTGHTILKKHSSMDSNNSGESSPKHTSFNESVEIVEYDKKSKVAKTKCVTHTMRLHDDKEDYMTITYNDERYVCKDRCPMPPKGARDETDAAENSEEDSETSDMDQSLESDPENVEQSAKSDHSTNEQSDSEMDSGSQTCDKDSSAVLAAEGTQSPSVYPVPLESVEMSSVLASKLMEVQLDLSEKRPSPLQAES